MTPVTGLARLPGRILWSINMENFSPVDKDEIQGTRTNMVLILKWKYIQDKNNAVLAAML